MLLKEILGPTVARSLRGGKFQARVIVHLLLPFCIFQSNFWLLSHETLVKQAKTLLMMGQLGWFCDGVCFDMILALCATAGKQTSTVIL